MKTTLPIIAAAAVFSVASLQAATTIVTASPDPIVISVGTLGTGTFASFDTSSGTLTKVTVKMTTLQRGDVTVTNTAAVSQTMHAQLSGTNTWSMDSGTYGDDKGVSLIAADVVDLAAGATHGYGTLTSATEVRSTDYTSGFSFFEGDGVATREVEFSATALWGVIAENDATLSISNLLADATIEVTYTYDAVTAVPEPSSALLGLLGAGFLVIRRKRA